MQAPIRSGKPAAMALGFAMVLWLAPFSVAENLNLPKSWSTALLSAESEEMLADEVTALPMRVPALIAPVVKAPTPVRNGRLSREMKRLAVKYDVTKIGERGVGKGLNFYSIDKEMQFGRQLAEEMEREVRIVRDPVISEYVNRLGQNLVRNSDAKVPFTIKVVDSPEVNAYALPGGYFYVNTGLILTTENEAQLAGVMSHEIAHVAARHATHNLTRRNLLSLCALPAVFVAGPLGMAIEQAANVALPMEFMKFSRDAEREADLLGMEYAYAAGYDPAAIVSLFEKIEAQEKKKKGFLARAFDTHPMSAERVKRAQEEMSTMLPAKDDYVVTTSEFNDVKARLEALVNHHVLEDAGDARPTLRRSAGDRETKPAKNGEDRPTLKRSGED